MYKFLLPSLVCLLIFSCEKEEDGIEQPRINSITIESVEILSLANEDSNQTPWDQNSPPDVFLTISTPTISPLTDTIVDFEIGSHQVQLLNEIEITREIESFRIEVVDRDNNLSLPPDLRSNDIISWFTIFPWSDDRLGLTDKDELIKSDRISELKITVRRQ